jgi:DNA-binding NarL/FixJ family response regulator
VSSAKRGSLCERLEQEKVATDSTSKARIVLADDVEWVRRLTNLLLFPYFDVVAMVGDGEAAIDAVARLKPDVLVLDIVMPLLDGLKTAQHLRDTESTTKVVFLTGYEDGNYAEAAMNSGASAVVFKSLLVADLPVAIRAALKGKKFVSNAP